MRRSSAFAELLADRELLIVIDDAWDAAHVRPFLQGGERCARLITTRIVDVLPAGRGGWKSTPCRRTKRGNCSATDCHADPAFGALAQRLGEWPLLLKLVNGALQERVLHQGQPLTNALAYVNGHSTNED